MAQRSPKSRSQGVKRQATARKLAKQTTFCIRRPSVERQEQDTYVQYKKGWEIRFSVTSVAQRRDVVKALKNLGLKPGKPYRKSDRMWIVPVYGQEAVALFDGHAN